MTMCVLEFYKNASEVLTYLWEWINEDKQHIK